MNNSINPLLTTKRPFVSPIFLLLVTLHFFSFTSSAQWVKTDTGIFGSDETQCFAKKGTTLFAGTLRGTYKSLDDGATWTSIVAGLPSTGSSSALAVSGSFVFAGSSSGVYRSSDDGASWTAVNSGLTNTVILSLLVNGTDLYAGTNGGGAFKSTDNGVNWTAINNGSLTSSTRVTSFTVNGSAIFAGTNIGVLKSTNSGATWATANTGLPVNNSVISLATIGANIFVGIEDTSGHVYKSTDNGATWAIASTGLPNALVNNFTVSSSGTIVFLGTIGDGAFKSTDNGVSWTVINTGLSSSTVNALVVNGTSLFAGTQEGIFKSTNDGTSWSAASAGLAAITVKSIALSGTDLFAGTTSGVFKSINNGATWVATNNGLTSTSVSAIVVKGSTIFAGTSTNGVFKSADNGASWTAVNTGLGNTFVRGLALNGTTLFVVTGGGGVYKLIDNSTIWAAANNGLTSTAGTAFAVSGTTIFVGMFDGVFKSTDDGANWTAASSGLANLFINSLLVSGSNLFAGTSGGGVFLSTNSGTSWTNISGDLTNLNISSLANSGSALFVGNADGVSLSINNGTNWISVSTGLPNSTFVQTLFLNGSTLLAGTSLRSLWSRPISEFVPTVTSFSPTSGPTGTTVTISGTGYSATPADNVVKFNGTTAVVTASTATSITTTVPAGATTGTVSVTVNSFTATSASNFTVTLPSPTITSFSPSSGVVGTTITITGTNFSATPANNSVSFNGTAATVSASTATSITTTVPTGATTGAISVTVNSLTATSSSNFTVTLPPPTITSFSPLSGTVGATVTITGTNFSTAPASNIVKFNGTTAVATASTATSITTTVPSGATTGTISVTVNSVTATSSSNFTVIDSTPPLVTNKTPGTIAQGSNIAVVATLSDAESGIVSANLLYRSISAGGNFTSVAMIAGADYTQAIPAASVGELGVEYKFEVTNGVGLTNNQVLNIVRVTLAGDGVVIPYTAPGIDASNYRIVSVPLELTAKSVGQVFDELGPLDNTKWRMSHFQNGTNSELNLSSSIEPGQGYWLIAKEDPGTINSGAGVTVNATSVSPFQINLAAGWNQIGNPYNFNISWADVQAANSGLSGLRKYDGSFADASTLNKMEGGFVNVPSARTLVFPAVKNAAANGGRISQDNYSYRNQLDKKNWQVYINLTQGNHENKIAGFGMHEKASEQDDPFDGLTMPRFFGEWLEVNHTKKNSRGFYSKDIVPSQESHTWEFVTETSSSESAMKFSWDNSYFGNVGPELYLWDVALQKSVNMRTADNYKFSRDRSKSFKVVFGSSSFIKGELAVEETVLHDPWPNPAQKNEMITISFSTPESTDVNMANIEVNDMIGRSVFQFEKSIVGGYHEVEWERSADVTPGFYVISLRAGSTKRQAKVLLR